ncbi:MAG TPA: heavy metal translocating P-type ATPase [Croceibacterium sp.]
MTAAVNRLPAGELRLASHPLGDGRFRTDLSLPGMHCGGCVARVEKALSALDGVESARANLSSRRVAVTWQSPEPPPLGPALDALGFEAHLPSGDAQGGNAEHTRLVRALAVAGFAAMNVMALSVAVWSGAASETRDLFHWISAAIALPALAYSGRVFFASAWQALRHGRTNMDVPISIGVVLAFAMSLYDTIEGQPHAYFDASISLLFFLLIGRTLDHMMRERARAGVTGLRRLVAYGATVVGADGSRDHIPVEEIVPGMRILVAAGERIPVDAVVLEGRSDIDTALATGESTPLAAAPGAELRAGTLNLTGPLTIRATAAARDSFLAEMVRLMETVESARSGYRRIADRASRLYAPVVHAAAFLAFLGWLWATGDWHRALGVAVAVLIITCPCALGLAVPMVQVVAARRLFERGIMVKDGSALERLAEADTVLFDKTGTLTLGRARLINRTAIGEEALIAAASIAGYSRHPHSLALAGTVAGNRTFDAVAERPGLGVEARCGAEVWRLGRAEWALAEASGQSGTVLSRDGAWVASFVFEDQPRPGTAAACAELAQLGMAIEIVSGDRSAPVAALAREAGIASVQSAMLPGDKVAHIAALEADGARVLMVGDGLNDAPALAAAHVSMAPANAADIGRQSADLVFLHPGLDAVPFAVGIARRAARLVRQNFALAVAYNAVALPLAAAGLLTPLIAALAMSASSLLVVANALRLSAHAPSRALQRAEPRRRRELVPA